jgi:tetratricopeptide (TPR) repeat protein
LKSFRRLGVALVSFALLLGTGAAQSPAKTAHTLIIFPFENASSVPGIEWIGEAFPEILGSRLASPSLYVLSRDDRMRAYEQIGIPAELHPSRATLYRIAEQMGADYVVFGRYDFNGQTFSATAQLLDMNTQRLSREIGESGPLVELIDIQSGLAWGLLHLLKPDLAISHDAFRSAAPPIRLDALENYIRGILASSPQDNIQRLHEAVRTAPSYTNALLQLGKTYYAQKQFEEAMSTLQRIPRGDTLAREANFYIGLAAYSRADYATAEAAFQYVQSQLPLTEVSNNLAAVEVKRGEKAALTLFQKAVDADPNDADYRFNLALAYYRGNDHASAVKQLREAVRAHPNDMEARNLLDLIGGPGVKPASTVRLPSERLKRNYDESPFRQLALEIQATAEQRLAKTDPRTHAAFHVVRGHELLGQGFATEAEGEFREAVSLDKSNPEAHAGLAHVLETKHDLAGARTEAETALRLRPFVEPLLVLTRLDLSENKADEANEHVNRALQLEPSNGSALALKRAIAAKLAEKAQPLPN